MRSPFEDVTFFLQISHPRGFLRVDQPELPEPDRQLLCQLHHLLLRGGGVQEEGQADDQLQTQVHDVIVGKCQEEVTL